MPKLIATTEFRYGGRQLKAQEAFDAPERDARTLIAIRKAQAAPDVAEPPAPVPRRQHRTAEPAPVEAAAMTTEDAPTPTRRRRYGRRDMSAEE